MSIQATNSKVLSVFWFTSKDCFGIVFTENEVGERKFYIGPASGLDEKADAIHIADYGSRIDPKAATEFLQQ